MSALDLTGDLTDAYLKTYRDYFKSIEKIGYYIHDRVSKIDDPSYYSWTHWDGHETAIHKAFYEIDSQIDLDFHETNNILEAQIHIYRVSPYPGIPNDVYGFALGSREGALIPSRGNDEIFQSVVWSDFPDDNELYYGNNPFLIDESDYDFGTAKWQDVHTIIHEIGHALGLSHPQSGGNDDPWGGHHDSEDTIMSYNSNISYDNYGIFAHAPSWSNEDISHLKLIWGDENGNNDHPTKASDFLVGTGEDETLYLFNGDDTMYAGGGNDAIYGGEGADIIYGEKGDDTLKGAGGKDLLYGGLGNDDLRGSTSGDTIVGGGGRDTVHGGNGRDILTGGSDGDFIYGGFGINTFESEKDGAIDSLYFKSDQWEENWLYGKAGNSPNGEKADKITKLDSFDRIYVEGVATNQLSYRAVSHQSNLGETLSGIGIYASGTLEAVYVGNDLSLGQISAMTRGIL